MAQSSQLQTDSNSIHAASTAPKLCGRQKYHINTVLGAIDQICASFAFGAQISERAKGIYKLMKEAGIVFSGRKLDALLVGCVFHAAREGNQPKISLQNWANSRGGLGTKDVRIAVKFIRDRILPKAKVISLAHFVGRICDTLGLDSETRKTADLIADGVRRLAGVRVKKSVKTQAATIVWIAGLLCGREDKTFRKQVANYAPCGVRMLGETYGQLCDYLPAVVPQAMFGREEEWKKKLPHLRVRTALTLG